MSELYDRAYFEEGFAAGVSCYTNYTWLPEFTIPLAHRLIQTLPIAPSARVLDYGCAKGFLVRALRLLDVDAYGCDISRYALSESESAVRPFLCQSSGPAIPFRHSFDWVIAKDVLEHLEKTELTLFLKDALEKSSRLFIVVPLGDGAGRYVAPQYEMDKTHRIREPLVWWTSELEKYGWKVKTATTNVKGIKDSWAHYEGANGVVIAHG